MKKYFVEEKTTNEEKIIYRKPVRPIKRTPHNNKH